MTIIKWFQLLNSFLQIILERTQALFCFLRSTRFSSSYCSRTEQCLLGPENKATHSTYGNCNICISTTPECHTHLDLTSDHNLIDDCSTEVLTVSWPTAHSSKTVLLTLTMMSVTPFTTQLDQDRTKLLQISTYFATVIIQWMDAHFQKCCSQPTEVKTLHLHDTTCPKCELRHWSKVLGAH